MKQPSITRFCQAEGLRRTQLVRYAEDGTIPAAAFVFDARGARRFAPGGAALARQALAAHRPPPGRLPEPPCDCRGEYTGDGPYPHCYTLLRDLVLDLTALGDGAAPAGSPESEPGLFVWLQLQLERLPAGKRAAFRAALDRLEPSVRAAREALGFAPTAPFECAEDGE